MWPAVWLSLDWHCVASVSGQPSLFASAHAGAANSIDAADQGVSNGHSLQKISSNPLFPARDYLPIHHVSRNYL